MRRFLPPAGTGESVAKLVQSASNSLDDAFNASACAPPGPGYLDRVRAIAEACEHFAATSLHASRTAGVSWKGRSDFGPDRLPYELRPNGNRPRRKGLWDPPTRRNSAGLLPTTTGSRGSPAAGGPRVLTESKGRRSRRASPDCS